jgi:hypothetical protein
MVQVWWSMRGFKIRCDKGSQRFPQYDPVQSVAQDGLICRVVLESEKADYGR